jgi:hypothetical protein
MQQDQWRSEPDTCVIKLSTNYICDRPRVKFQWEDHILKGSVFFQADVYPFVNKGQLHPFAQHVNCSVAISCAKHSRWKLWPQRKTTAVLTDPKNDLSQKAQTRFCSRSSSWRTSPASVGRESGRERPGGWVGNLPKPSRWNSELIIVLAFFQALINAW